MNFIDSAIAKNSIFEIYDGSDSKSIHMVLIKSDLSYDDVIEYLKANKYKLFNKYVRTKFLCHSWEAGFFLKYHELK